MRGYSKLIPCRNKSCAGFGEEAFVHVNKLLTLRYFLLGHLKVVDAVLGNRTDGDNRRRRRTCFCVFHPFYTLF